MNQIESREIIRDEYNVKHYEIIHTDGTTFVYTNGLERFLKGEEAGSVLEEFNSPEPRLINQLRLL